MAERLNALRTEPIRCSISSLLACGDRDKEVSRGGTAPVAEWLNALHTEPIRCSISSLLACGDRGQIGQQRGDCPHG